MKTKRIIICALLLVLLLGNFISICSASWVEDLRCWYWTDNTEIRSVAVGDIDGDGSKDIVTGGNYFDGTRWVSQLVVWDGTSGAVKKVKCWHWGDHTCIFSIAVGNIDSDNDIEIVTGGYYFDANDIARALLAVWRSGTGQDLTLEHCDSWYYGSTTLITSVAIGNIDGDAYIEVVAGGTYYDGNVNHYNAFLREYEHDATTLTYKNQIGWYYSVYDTWACSIAFGNADSDGYNEIAASGYYYNGAYDRAWLDVLEVYSGSFEFEYSTTWDTNYCGTHANSVAIGNVDGDSTPEIVTGGYYVQSNLQKSQIKVWSVWNNALDEEDTYDWYTTANTYVASVAIGDCDYDGQIEIVSGGAFNDGSRKNSQFKIFTGSDLTVEETKSWYWTSNTEVFSVVVDNLARDLWKDIVTGGYYYDGARDQSQLVVWTTRPSAALMWGTSNYESDEMGGQDEEDASVSVCQEIYGLFDAKDRYGYPRNFQGINTQPNGVYENVSYCEGNFAYTAIFYKGHICPDTWSCGVQNCPGSPHSSVYDVNGAITESNQIIDYLIHQDEYGAPRLSSRTHDFVFIWACDWGNPDRIGGFSGSHSWGMMASWMNTNSLLFDGYGNIGDDESDRCYISFINSSIMFKAQTGYASKNYGNWTERFFYWALQDGYSIKDALDQATRDTHGIYTPFSQCQLYTGYKMIVQGQEWNCRMVVYGDVYHEMAR
jgi:hypothetical protein